MATVVIPFRNGDPKRRLDGLDEATRGGLALAMLGDVVDAALPVGPVFVVAPAVLSSSLGVTQVPDPGRGQGLAVRAALDAAVAAASPSPFLVVNADLPCATTRDLLALAVAAPKVGLALVAALDGTTNALALSSADLFRPLYGEGSAGRFSRLGPSRLLDAPNLVDDVDTLADLERLRDRLGRRTRRALEALDRLSAA